MREQRFEVICVAGTEHPYLRGKPEEDRHVTVESKGHIKTLIQGSKKGLQCTKREELVQCIGLSQQETCQMQC